MARTELTGKQIKDHTVDLVDDTTGVLPVANGGTGSDTLAANAVLLGNGTGALQAVAPGTSGYVLTSNGSTWTAAAPTGGGGGGAGDVTLDGEQTLTNKTISGLDNTLSSISQDSITGLTGDLADKQSTSERGQPDGYASLGSDGLVPLSQLPENIGGGAVDSVNGYTGVVVLTASDVGLGQVDNTADTDKPISTAVQTALDDKSDVGHGHTQGDILDLTTDLASKQNTSEKDQPGGYVGLDMAGKIASIQLPAGMVIDSVQVMNDTFQLYSGGTPVGDPISLLVSSVDGGTPTTVTESYIDGGLL